VRTVQSREPRRYLAAPDAALTRHVLAAEQLPFEFMLNALRLAGGFPQRSFTERTGLEWGAIGARIAALRERGLMEVTATACRPSALGLRFVNDLLLEFMPETSKMPGSSALSMTTRERGQGASAPLYTGLQGPNAE
jgi:oxygen-independent coproporphyrinogen-3 oxidase